MTKSAHLIYFSPTGTTRKISVSIAEGLGAETITHYDVTRPEASLATVLTDGVAETRERLKRELRAALEQDVDAARRSA